MLGAGKKKSKGIFQQLGSFLKRPSREFARESWPVRSPFLLARTAVRVATPRRPRLCCSAAPRPAVRASAAPPRPPDPSAALHCCPKGGISKS